MTKLLTAKQALALSESSYSLEKALTRVDDMIRTAAELGTYRVAVKMTEPIHMVEAVVARLKNVGYQVCYSSIHSDYTMLMISWR